MTNVSATYLKSSDFAILVGISRQTAHSVFVKALSGETWHGKKLNIRKSQGQGGKSGKSYEVLLSSLPDEYQIKWQQQNPQLPEQYEMFSSREYSEVTEWRYSLIKEAIKHPAKSNLRSQFIAAQSQEVRLWPSGKRKAVSIRTLREWCHDYDQKGMAGLEPKKRDDKGHNRVLISHKWDNTVPFNIEIKQKIANHVQRCVRSLWAANTELGWSKIALLAKPELQDQTILSGFTPAKTMLNSICNIPRGFVERERHYRAVAEYDLDHKKWFDKSKPRIQRKRDDLNPMDIIVGDVHHIDIQMKRPDGSTFTPKAIAWQDSATNRMFIYPVFLKKGEGVRQDHVIEAFIAMVTHPEWGMPGTLYLDNGGEYNWAEFIDDAMQLKSYVSDARSGKRGSMVVKAMPYNAAAKSIEGIFGVLEGGVLSTVTGWIGGNRMKKKTQNIGKSPEVFPGSYEDFKEVLNNRLTAYENIPQAGSLKGKSPRETYNQAVLNDWKRTDIDINTLAAVFAKSMTRTINQGKVRFNSVFYTHRKLQALPAGTNVCLRVPLFGDKTRIAVLNNKNETICIATPERGFDLLDPAGAKESSARTKANLDAIKKLKKDIDPVDFTALYTKLNENAPTPLIPEQGAVLKLSGPFEDIGNEMSLGDEGRADRDEHEHNTYLDEWDKAANKLMRVTGGNL